MPELPEVETTRQHLLPHLTQQKVIRLTVRERRLRWPVTEQLMQAVSGNTIRSVTRRAKYLLLNMDDGTLMIHLGMSGHIRILANDSPPAKHDHIDLALSNGQIMRFNDPRRFGAWLWTAEPVLQHPLLCNLGLEPLTPAFNGRYLQRLAQSRKIAVKAFVMDQHIVVGVGNIYAAEALFTAGVHPSTSVNQLLLSQWDLLVKQIKRILRVAIKAKGTTIRNFAFGEGVAGRFKQSLAVYGRQGLPCKNCATPLTQITIAQRSSVFCSRCQE